MIESDQALPPQLLFASETLHSLAHRVANLHSVLINLLYTPQTRQNFTQCG